MFNEAFEKGEHLDDLVDKEMVSLLGVCKRLQPPLIDSIKDKFVTFGNNNEGKKLFILDMDETMLHAKFLETEEDIKKDLEQGNY